MYILPHNNAIQSTVKSSVGASASKPFSSLSASVSIRIQNTHASNTLYIEIDGTDASTTSASIAPGAGVTFNAFTMFPDIKDISLYGSDADTTFVAWIQ